MDVLLCFLSIGNVNASFIDLTMPTCVECGAAVSSLYTEYSKGNIRLTYCVWTQRLAFP